MENYVKRLVDELKEAGKGGKKQWEDAVKSTRDLIARAPAVGRKDLERALDAIRARGDEWTSSDRFLSARDKGARLLLKLVGRVKETAARLEKQLEPELRQAA